MNNNCNFKRVNVKKLARAILVVTFTTTFLGLGVGYAMGKASAEAEKIYIEKTENFKTVENIEQPEKMEVLENFKITAYCPCSKCCGKFADGITATGTAATEGRTIAVDPEVIPYGSKVVIDGKEYIAEDCGGAIKGKRIDLFFETHQEALEYGVQNKLVKVIERG